MGDRFVLNHLCCSYCRELTSEEQWYAPTCGSFDFVCKSCGKLNYISWSCEATKIEDIPEEEIQWVFQDYSFHPIAKALLESGERYKKEIEVECPHSNRALIESIIERVISD